MLSYVIRRILLILPTVFFILICSFFLQTLAPGDSLGDQLRIDGKSIHSSQKSYHDAYKRLQKQLDLDQPRFYFAMRPSYFPDTLYRVVPKQKRGLLSTLTRQTKNWEVVDAFHKAHVRAIYKMEGERDSRKHILAALNKMSISRDLTDIRIYQKELNELLAGLSPDDKLYEVEQVSTQIDVLTESGGLYVPSLRWHGFSNQFHSWMMRIFSKKNVSSIDGKPAVTKIKEALRWTISMGLITLILIAIFSLFLAYIQVRFDGTWIDNCIAAFLYIMIAMPTFWLATLMVVFFTTPEYGAWTHWFPSIGIKPSFVEKSFLTQFIENSSQLALPIFCLTILSASYLAILTKSDILNELSRPYIKTAQAKGLSYKKILRSHAIPNSLVSYITILTGAIPFIFTGSVIIEVIFNIPGVGRLLLYSVQFQDWSVVYTIVVMISIVTIVGYLIGDILLAKLYPKTITSLTE